MIGVPSGATIMAPITVAVELIKIPVVAIVADNPSKIQNLDSLRAALPTRLEEDTLRSRSLWIRLTIELLGAQADSESSLGWTLVLRRQPARIVDGQPQGGYSDAFELICCDCGDDPDLDYHHVSRGLQQIRGPYSIAAGIAAYEKHVPAPVTYT